MAVRLVEAQDRFRLTTRSVLLSALSIPCVARHPWTLELCQVPTENRIAD